MYIKYSKISPTAQEPTRSNQSDAGLDVYVDIENHDTLSGKNFIKFKNSITLEKNGNVIIPTGLKFEIPNGYCMMVCNRSGNASKKSLVYGAHIIDSEYSGEVFIDIHNIGSIPQKIYHADKIAQLVMVPVLTPILIETEEENLYKSHIKNSNRGSNGFGSTNLERE